MLDAVVLAGPPVLVNTEYDSMTRFWCAQPQRATSSICKRRAFTERLKVLSGDARKKALAEAPPRPSTAAARKAMSDDAKQMVQAWCATAEGGATQLCVQSIGVLELGLSLIHI